MKKNLRKKTVSPIRRLAFIRGQIDGLMRMVEDDRDCLTILTQLKAIKSGLEKAGALLTAEYLTKCLADGKKKGKKSLIEKAVTEILHY